MPSFFSVHAKVFISDIEKDAENNKVKKKKINKNLYRNTSF